MADPMRRFHTYFADTRADPYGNTPELVLQNTYAPDVAITRMLFGITVSNTYPLLMLMSDSGGRIYPMVAPFDQPVLPGQATIDNSQ